MYVGVHVCVFVCVCMCLWVGVHVCMYVCMYVCEEGGRWRDVRDVRTTDVTKPPGPVLV